MKLLILSDIHGNWPALEALLLAEPDFNSVAFCGDVVDYGPQPVECIRWLAANGGHMVRGNHDNALAFGVDCQCMGSFRPYSVATRVWHRTLVDRSDVKFLASMPTLDWFEWQGKHFRMAHATPFGDLFEYLSPERWGERIQELDADFVLLGHTHVQGMRNFGKTTVVNPGSVGLARDTPGLACYAVLEEGQVRLMRIAYDVSRTVAALRKAPLPKEIIEGLAAVLQPRNVVSGTDS